MLDDDNDNLSLSLLINWNTTVCIDMNIEHKWGSARHIHAQTHSHAVEKSCYQFFRGLANEWNCVCMRKEEKKITPNFVHKFTNNMGKVFFSLFSGFLWLCVDTDDAVIVWGFEYLCSHTHIQTALNTHSAPDENVWKKFRCDSACQAEKDAADDDGTKNLNKK